MYSILYMRGIVFSIEILGVLVWGIFISFMISLIYMTILTICNILTEGSFFASLTVAMITVVSLVVFAAIEGVMDFLPAWALDFVPTRNNGLLVLIYVSIFCITTFLMHCVIKRKRI